MLKHYVRLRRPELREKMSSRNLKVVAGGQNTAAVTTKLGGAGDRLGEYLSVDCTNFLSLSGCDQFTDPKFTRPIAKISKSSHDFQQQHLTRKRRAAERVLKKTRPREIQDRLRESPLSDSAAMRTL